MHGRCSGGSGVARRLIALSRCAMAGAIGAMAATIVANLLGDRTLGRAITFALCHVERHPHGWLIERHLSGFNLTGCAGLWDC